MQPQPGGLKRTPFHISASSKRARATGRRDVAVQYKELTNYLQSKLFVLRKLNFFRHFTYHSYYTLFVFMWCICGAAIFCDINGLFFVDSLLLSVSAFCEAGLSPLSMLDLHHDSFVVLTVLVFFGNSMMMLVYPLIARIYHFRKVLKNITAVDKAVLDEYMLWYEGSIVFLFVVVIYIAVSLCMGVLVLYFALQQHDIEPEMVRRGFSPFVIAGFTSISAFANAGFALSTSQLFYYKNNPMFYTTLSVLILLGNTASPIALRWCMSSLHSVLHATKHRWPVVNKYINVHAVKYVLDNPRRITTNLFSSKETSFLGTVLVIINLLQYVCYLASTLNRKEALVDGNQQRLAAIGTFQTVVTRTAGFQIVDLRTVNQGMLVVYALAMYLSAVPFLSTMYLTEDSVDQVSQLNTAVSDSDSEGSLDDMDERFKPPVLKRSQTNSIAMNIKNNFMTKHVYYLLFAVMLLAFTEDGILTDEPEVFNLWYIVFEVSSAYGGVGLSLGIPGKTYSLCGGFSTVGKLIITAVIFLGKHRGLPQATDAVIDFKFNRLKRASRRKAKASVKMSEKPKSMIRNVIDTVQHRVEAISPRTPRNKQAKSNSIAILELKPREKRKNSVTELTVPKMESGRSENSMPRRQTRGGSYHDMNPNLPPPDASVSLAGEDRDTVPAPRRNSFIETMKQHSGGEGTGFSPVDAILAHIGAIAPNEADATVQPFVYSPRSSRSRKSLGDIKSSSKIKLDPLQPNIHSRSASARKIVPDSTAEDQDSKRARVESMDSVEGRVIMNGAPSTASTEQNESEHDNAGKKMMRLDSLDDN